MKEKRKKREILNISLHTVYAQFKYFKIKFYQMKYEIKYNKMY